MNKSGGYLKGWILVAAALFVLAFFVVAVPSSIPGIVTTSNSSTLNVSTAVFGSDQLFGYANFSSDATPVVQEGNSTFKWFKRTQYLPQNNSLLFYYRLDGNGNDASSYGTTLSNSNAVDNQSMNCAIDDCFNFNGVGSQFTGVPRFNETGSQQITVEFWFMYLQGHNGTANMRFVNHIDASAPIKGWQCDNQDPGKEGSWRCEFFNQTGGSDSISTQVVGLTNGTWHHFAWTYKAATANGNSIYIDGNLIKTQTSTQAGANGLGNANKNLTLGALTNGAWLNASLDEVAAWNYAKSAAEIQSDYANSRYSALIYKDAVAYWHLDENGGGNYTDSSSHNFNGAPIGNVTNVTGIIKGGVYLNGSAINITDATLNINNTFTISAWIYPTLSNGTQVGVVAKWGYQANMRNWMLQVGTQNVAYPTIDFFLDDDGSTAGRFNYESTTQILNNTWYHVVGTWNGTNATLYVNGVKDSVLGGTTKGIKNVANNNTQIYIGAEGVGAADKFIGVIDEVGIWNHSFTDVEVTQLYLRTQYDVAPQTFLLQPYASNATGLNTTDNRRPALVKNVSNVTGAFAGTQAAGFNGENSIINYTPNAFIANLSEVTMEAWVKMGWMGDNGGSDFRTIITNTNLYTISGLFLVYSEGSGNFIMGAGNGSAAPASTSRAATAANGFNDTWVYLAGTVSRNGTIKLYLNGALAATTNMKGNLLTGDRFFSIGGDGQDRHWNGSIGEVRISRKALTAQEINLTYGQSRPDFQNQIFLNGSNYNVSDGVLMQYSPLDVLQAVGLPKNTSTTYFYAPASITPFTITFGIGTITNSSFINKNWAFINVSTNYTGNTSMTVQNGSTSFSNVNAFPNGFNFNFTGLNDGNYTWSATATAGGNTNTTSTNITFIIDTQAPLIVNSAVGDTANGTAYSGTSLNVNKTFSGLYESSALFNFNSSLMGWWRMEEQNGVTLSDSSGYGNSLSWTAVQQINWTVLGKRGGGLYFQNSTQRPSSGSSSWPNFTNVSTSTFTIEGFVSFTNVTVGIQRFWGFSGPKDTGSCRYGGTSLGISFFLANTTGQSPEFGTGFRPANDTWYHVACVFNGTHGLIYINGNLSKTFAFLGTLAGANQFFVGNSGVEGLNGTIDEVKVWKRALSAAEINASYRADVYGLTQSIQGLPDGQYNYTVSAVDQAGNMNQSNYTVRLDNNYPSFTIYSPSPNNLTVSRVLNVNFTCSSTHLYDCGVTVLFKNNGTVFYTNLSENLTTTSFSKNFTLDVPVTANYTLLFNATNDLTFSPPVELTVDEPVSEADKPAATEFKEADGSTAFKITPVLVDEKGEETSNTLSSETVKVGNHYETTYSYVKKADTAALKLKITGGVDEAVPIYRGDVSGVAGHFKNGMTYFAADDAVAEGHTVETIKEDDGSYSVLIDPLDEGLTTVVIDPRTGGLDLANATIFALIDVEAPTYANNGSNDSVGMRKNLRFDINWTDITLTSLTFQSNFYCPATPANQTFNVTGNTTYNLSINVSIPDCMGNYAEWKWYAIDTVGNANATPQFNTTFCVETWQVTGWVRNGTYEYRSVTDTSNCGTSFLRPETVRLPPPPDGFTFEDIFFTLAFLAFISLTLLELWNVMKAGTFLSIELSFLVFCGIAIAFGFSLITRIINYTNTFYSAIFPFETALMGLAGILFVCELFFYAAAKSKAAVGIREEHPTEAHESFKHE